MFELRRTEEQLAVADALRRLGERTIRPALAHGGVPAPGGLDPAWAALTEMGLCAPTGADRPGLSTAMLIAEEVGFGDPGVAYELVCRSRASAMIEDLGTPAQRREFLPAPSSGRDRFASVAYFEGFGRSPSELRTRARQHPDGWLLSGHKIGVGLSDRADVLVVIAADDTGEPTAFALRPSAVPGVRLVRDDAAVGKLGADAARTGDVELSEVSLPRSARLSGPDVGAVRRAVQVLRLEVAAVLLGTARAALAYAADYADTRSAFGRPISSYQGVAFPLVDADIEIDAARLLVWRAAWALDRDADAGNLVAEAVARAGRAAMDTTRTAVNTLGGHGFISDHPVEQWYRAAAVLTALDFDPLEADCAAL